jgi:uncharacterized protein
MESTRLLKASVWHLRERPKRNEFTYAVYYVAYELGGEKVKKPTFFSFDRWNILSLYKKDLGPKDGTDWLPWVRSLYQQNGVQIEGTDTVEVISHPRLFGYAFNPITFWLLLDASKHIKAVVCEVHNTFGGNHNYVLSHKDGSFIKPEDVFIAQKELYVSPFNSMEGYYKFSFVRTPKKFKADIFYYVGEDSVVKTSMAGEYATFSSRTIIGVVIMYPLMTLLVVARIHWQALILFIKGVPHTLHNRPINKQ